MTDPVLEIVGLTASYPSAHGPVPAVRGVSISLAAGTVVAVVGESGSGKTTLALAAGNLGPRELHIEGEIRLDAAQPDRTRPGWQGRVGFVFQDPRAAFDPLYRIDAQLSDAFRCRHRSAPRTQARERVRASLAEVAITNVEQVRNAYPHQLSGGLAQRVAIAAALIGDPIALIADEPTSALDATTQAKVLTILADVAHGRGIPVLWVTHDIGAAADYSDFIAVMFAGQIVEYGPARDVIAEPRMPYTQALLRARPSEKGDWLARAPSPTPTSGPDRPGGCAFRGRCMHTRPPCDCVDVPLLDCGDGRTVRCPNWLELQAAGVGMQA